MASDVILEDHRVRVVDAHLEVERNVEVGSDDRGVRLRPSGRIEVRDDGDTTTVTAHWVLTDRILSDSVATDALSVDDVRVGPGRPDEPGNPGQLSVEDGHGGKTIRMEGSTGNVSLGGDGEDGDLMVLNADGNITVGVNGRTGNVVCGGSGTDGDLALMDSEGRRLIVLDAGESEPIDDSVTIYMDGKEADLVVGRRINDGSLTLLDRTGEARVRIGGYQDPDDPTADTDEPDELQGGAGGQSATRVRIDMEGSMGLGGDGHAGSLRLFPDDGAATVLADGDQATLRLGEPQSPQEGRLVVMNEFGSVGVELENTDARASGSVRAGLISEPTAFREQHAVIADQAGVRVGRMDDSGNFEETVRISTDGRISAVDIDVGSVQGLVQIIEDLQNRVQQLENAINNP